MPKKEEAAGVTASVKKKSEADLIKEMNIYQRLYEATNEIAIVAKNLQVDTGKGKGYKAVSEADVLAAVKPIEYKYRIQSGPVARSIIKDGEIVNQTQYGEKRSLFVRLETVYRFTNIDKPDEYIDITTYGDGVDPQDKAPGKAMTYADKYALMKAYKIQTGDDPDKEASGDLIEKRLEAPDPNAPASTADKLKFRQACQKYHIDDIATLYRVGWTQEQGKMTYRQYVDAMKLIAKEYGGQERL